MKVEIDVKDILKKNRKNRRESEKRVQAAVKRLRANYKKLEMMF